MITTHVLDTTRGCPACGVPVVLEVRSESGSWRALGRATTNADGRVRSWATTEPTPERGTYRLTFDTAAYFRGIGVAGFYPEVPVVFEVRDPSHHHHVPLLLSPFGYATYRGS